jgi:hypothetical protein
MLISHARVTSAAALPSHASSFVAGAAFRHTLLLLSFDVERSYPDFDAVDPPGLIFFIEQVELVTSDLLHVCEDAKHARPNPRVDASRAQQVDGCAGTQVEFVVSKHTAPKQKNIPVVDSQVIMQRGEMAIRAPAALSLTLYGFPWSSRYV